MVPAIENSEKPGNGASMARCVLVVEDDEALNNLVQKTLRRAGFETIGVSTGADAIERVMADPTLVLLLDQKLPDMAGTELIRVLIAQDRRPPFIAMTGHGDEKTAVEMMKLGATDYLVKDIELTDILPKVLRRMFRELETERRLSLVEQALKESEFKYRTLADSGQALIWTSGLDRKCDYFNQPWLSFTGRTLDQELGDGWTEGVHPQDFDRCLATYATAFDKRERFSMEYRLRDATGKYRWIQDDGTPRFDGEGIFLGFIGHCLDITERKQVEEKLRKSEETLIRAQHVGKIGSWWYDPAIRKSTWTEEMFHIFGLEPKTEGIAYEEHREIIHPEDWDCFDSAVKQAAVEGIGYDIELRIKCPSGELKHINTKCFAQKNNKGHVVELIGTCQDITARKQIETQLRQAQKIEAVGTLAGGIAHDFNNLLFPIIGMAEMLLEDVPPEHPSHENLQVIYKTARRAGNLVKQILSFSRQSDHKKIPVRIQQILKEVIKLSRSTIPSSIKIYSDIQDDCGLVMADPTQLHQIAMNLITNAYHAIEEAGGEISVRLKETPLTNDDPVPRPSEAGKYAMLTVSDTGHGIDPSVMDRIFEPYFTTKAQGKGTGLGLSVVYGILKEHGGDIRVTSEVGKGTTVNVYLPLLKKSRGATPAEGVAVYETGTESILLVDDEQAITRLETQMLERLGYRVTACTSSAKALEAFRDNPEAFDLILTDMTMPNMTGVQLSEKLRAIRPGIPIIICTGFSEKIDEDKANAIGIKGFLMKPVLKSDMAKMVRKVLDGVKGKAQQIIPCATFSAD